MAYWNLCRHKVPVDHRTETIECRYCNEEDIWVVFGLCDEESILSVGDADSMWGVWSQFTRLCKEYTVNSMEDDTQKCILAKSIVNSYIWHLPFSFPTCVVTVLLYGSWPGSLNRTAKSGTRTVKIIAAQLKTKQLSIWRNQAGKRPCCSLLKNEMPGNYSLPRYTMLVTLVVNPI